MNPPLTLLEEIELLSLDDETGAHLPLHGAIDHHLAVIGTNEFHSKA
ncbi:MAG: hypothetical protein JHC85_11420 [Chthoniobacterales bacterium]|jgi:hypothetical protein|nr:hypothetical protein [Chthoniobacterales bacterium]